MDLLRFKYIFNEIKVYIFWQENKILIILIIALQIRKLLIKLI
jgi:hypothetical protein